MLSSDCGISHNCMMPQSLILLHVEQWIALIAHFVINTVEQQQS